MMFPERKSTVWHDCCESTNLSSSAFTSVWVLLRTFPAVTHISICQHLLLLQDQTAIA